MKRLHTRNISKRIYTSNLQLTQFIKKYVTVNRTTEKLNTSIHIFNRFINAHMPKYN